MDLSLLPAQTTSTPEGADCGNCPLFYERDGKAVPSLNIPNKRIILAEAPGPKEVEQGRPLVGSTGKWLRNVLSRHGLNLDDFGLVNTLCCRPRMGLEDYIKHCNKQEATNPLDCCRNRLLREIAGADVVIALGNYALQALTGLRGIKTWRGSPLRTVLPAPLIPIPLPNAPARDGNSKRVPGETWILPTYHPTFFMHSPELAVWEDVVRVDLAKFVSIIANDGTTWDESGFHPEAGAYDLLDALKRARQAKVVSVDIETLDAAVMVTDLICTGFAFDNESWVLPYTTYTLEPWVWPEANGDPIRQARISYVLDREMRGLLADPSITKVFHNGIFDITVLERLGYVVAGRIVDTMFMHHASYSTLPHSLAFVGSIYTQGRYWKSDIKDDKPWKKENVVKTKVVCGDGEISIDDPGTPKLGKAAMLRLSIFEHLVNFGPSTSLQLQTVFGLTNATISPRRGDLQKAGLIHVTGRGNESTYYVAIEPDKVDTALVNLRHPARKAKEALKWNPASQRDFHLYNCRDTGTTLRSARAMVRDSRFQAQKHIYEHEMEMVAISREMTKRGMLIDQPKLFGLQKRLVVREAECIAAMQALLATSDYATHRGLPAETFKPTAPRDIACALLALGVPITTRTKKTGALATDKDTIALAAPLATPEGRDFIRLLTYNPKHNAEDLEAIGYRSARKLRSTYIENPPILSDGRMHANWKLHGTLSGRMSASPNLMNWPKWLRAIAIAPPGYRYVGADYSQIELRVQAYCSGDPALLHAFATGDPHSANAALIFQLELTPDFKVIHKHERDLAKRYIYALGYGSSDAGIHTRLLPDYPSLKLEMVEFVGKRIKRSYPHWMEWRNSTLVLARKLKYVSSALLGRRRYFTGEVVVTECMNFTPQATAADVINLTSLRLAEIKRDSYWKDVWLVNQCHDAILYEVPEEKAEAWANIMKEVMPGPFRLRTPSGEKDFIFPAEIVVGDNWSVV